MRNKKFKFIFLVLIILIGGLVWFLRTRNNALLEEMNIEISPFKGTIQTFISTTATVLPKNRLEVKPPVNGRIESILVLEGQYVKTGDILAWMSSTERAALLDAARGQGEETLAYWKQVYKAIPLLSPIDAEVIVATTQPGQTVTTSDAVVVLSDNLIVRAQVDETDIGKIKPEQDAIVILDAYPENKIPAKVEHMYYESKTVNNVTIYEVDLLPDQVPAFFRSGMNATVDFKENSKGDILLVPVEAVHKEKNESFVYLNASSKDPIKRTVKLGITDDKNIEIISGLDINDKIIVKEKKYVLPKNTTGKNPFMPSHPSGR